MDESIVSINGRKRKPSQKSLKTRQQILKEAKRIFSLQGFDNSTTKDIAQAAGVAEGTVFLHFENKQGLINHVVIDFYTRLQQSSDVIMAQEIDPFLKIRALIMNQLRMMEEDWRLGRIIFGRHGRYVNTDFAEEFYKLNRDYARLYIVLLETLKQNGRIRSTTSSQLIRDTLLGSMEHFAIGHFNRKREYNLAEFVDQLFDLVFFGCGNTGGKRSE